MAKKSTALLEAMREDAAQPAPKDRLDKIRVRVTELRDLEKENADLTERMAKNSMRIRDLREKELVDLLDQAKIKGFTLEADGNAPAFEIEVGPYYHANIAADWEPSQRQAAFDWLRKKNHGDMIKAQYTVDFGRGQEKQQRAFEAALKKAKYNYKYDYGVPWNTLTAFVKEQIEEKKATLPLKLLGATVGRVAKIVKQKGK